MAKVSLEDLRKGSPVTRIERVYSLCLRGDLVAQVDALSAELTAAPIEGQPTRKGGNPGDADRRKRLERLTEEMDDATGDLRLRAITEGEWRRWVNDHPAREDDSRDDQVAYGMCNTDDLANDLGLWTVSWNGDELAPDDWSTIFAPNASGGDLKALVNLVVMMQEAADDPKWRLRALRGAQSSSDSDPSPAQ